MTRFLYLSDTHIGAEVVGFQQQPAYPEKLDELLSTVAELACSGEIDFVLHGGDMVDTCTPATIARAKQLFDLPVPVYLSLGNHDLDREDALSLWLTHAPEFFIDQSPQYTIEHADCDIHVTPNQWETGMPYYWRSQQEAYFLEDQLHVLEEAIAKSRGKNQWLAIHNPIYGVPKEQSGAEHIIHDAPPLFREVVVTIMESHPELRGVLSGHSHINTLKQTEAGVYLSASSFIEAPFEYKIIEVTQQSLSIRTHAVSGLSFQADYDAARSFVQGREIDRSLHWRLSE
ncbi:metallophosphoesterase family protein [Paenibacillus mendelii]|uniref:Metallophosphoesterase family protein n=1 Tax=Paenibacillus mendelii TaxID=206163 RepID=A0ABV6JIZ0_9BACL|nr:metallophosphoesterase [Paenibacillus mendelii]MCQ6558805.1 metallophosphoesterase [Paenibacillus mendelii]